MFQKELVQMELSKIDSSTVVIMIVSSRHEWPTKSFHFSIIFSLLFFVNES